MTTQPVRSPETQAPGWAEWRQESAAFIAQMREILDEWHAAGGDPRSPYAHAARAALAIGGQLAATGNGGELSYWVGEGEKIAARRDSPGRRRLRSV